MSRSPVSETSCTGQLRTGSVVAGGEAAMGHTGVSLCGHASECGLPGSWPPLQTGKLLGTVPPASRRLPPGAPRVEGRQVRKAGRPLPLQRVGVRFQTPGPLQKGRSPAAVAAVQELVAVASGRLLPRVSHRKSGSCVLRRWEPHSSSWPARGSQALPRSSEVAVGCVRALSLSADPLACPGGGGGHGPLKSCPLGRQV